jgi:raffinose/stachyose/melibiose transport system substrate-binding protein
MRKATWRKTGLGWFFFPEVKGAKGKANDLFRSLDGWLITKDPPKETMDFMKNWLDKDNQIKLAAPGLFIPAAKGAADAIQVPFLKQIVEQIDRNGSRLPWTNCGGPIQRVLNDVSADLASGNTTPEKAGQGLDTS